ncbi:MAG: hypothetical protein JJU00_08780 [Opitutales bacterium]|nr:hypothetical protein [Opitutales bacterium]
MIPLELLSLHKSVPHAGVWTPVFQEELKRRGNYRLFDNTRDWDAERIAETVRGADVLVTAWDAPALPESLAADPGRLRYICHVNGAIRSYVPRAWVERGMAVSNWGPAPARRVAEGALALLLGSLKQLSEHVIAKRSGEWRLPRPDWSGSVDGLRLSVFGLGVIGKAFLEFVRPLNPALTGFDPYLADWPEGMRRAGSLDELFTGCDAVVIAAGLNDETRRSVDARRLAMLPEGGIVVNVARGGIIDQDALLAEVRQGRLRAALDVLDTGGKDWFEPDDPARQLPNLLLTAHAVAANGWNAALRGAAGELRDFHRICLDNIDRFRAGEPVEHAFDLDRYDRST